MSGLNSTSSSRRCSLWLATIYRGLDEAIQKLEKKDARKASLVKLRFFAGLTTAQAAEALGVSIATAESDWTYAHSWLRLEMIGGQEQETNS